MIALQKDKFMLPEGVYLCGHSLGPMSHPSKTIVEKTFHHWASNGIESWGSAQWLDLPAVAGAKIAKLVGARADEIIVTDSTTVNLYKVLRNALSLNPQRQVILTEVGNFPADLYIANGITASHDVKVVCVETENLIASMNESVGVLLLSHVNYRSAHLHDIKALTTQAQALGIIVVWDLSHSVGTIPLTLQELDIDFAVGCTYKFLNGGPGAPAFIYVNQKHHQTIFNPIYGWMGHAAPFEFSKDYMTTQNARAFLGGTPGILSMQSLLGALSVFDNIDMQTLRAQNLYYLSLIQQALSEHPLDPSRQGGHIAFYHPEARALSQQLIQAGIICDYRHPGLIRMSVSALYHDEADIRSAVEVIRCILNRV